VREEVQTLQKQIKDVMKEDDVKLMISSATKNIADVSAITNDIADLKESVQNIEENQLEYSNTLRELPSFTSIMSKVDEKLKKLKDQQKQVDAQQDNQKAGSDEINYVMSKIDELEEEVEAKYAQITTVEALSKKVEGVCKDIDSTNKKVEILSKTSNEHTQGLDQYIHKTEYEYQIEQLQDSINEALSILPKVTELEKNLDKNENNDEDANEIFAQRIVDIEKQMKTHKQHIDQLNDKIDNNEDNDDGANEVFANKINNIEQEIKAHKEMQKTEFNLLSSKIQKIHEKEDEEGYSPFTSKDKVDPKEIENLNSGLEKRISATEKSIQELQNQAKDAHDKVFGKIGELKAEMDKTDSLIEKKIIEINKINDQDTTATIKEIIDIKQEIFENQNTLEKKFNTVNKEENQKHKDVLTEISKIYSLIDEKHDHITTSIKKLEEAPPASNPFNSKAAEEVEVKQKESHTEFEAKFKAFKEESSKDKEFERERILNCVKELNETKDYCQKLVKKEISDLSEVENKKHNALQTKIQAIEKEIKAVDLKHTQLDKSLQSRDEKFSKMQTSTDELFQKYAKVQRFANEQAEKVI